MRFPNPYSSVQLPDSFATNRLAILDACVLANYQLCDTLLRIAEPPALFEPKWSVEIIDETVRVLQNKLNWPTQVAGSFQRELKANFAEALS